MILFFLREQSWRNSFALKRGGNCYLNSLFFITKFTEREWNDCDFGGSEEHRRCSRLGIKGKGWNRKVVKLMSCEGVREFENVVMSYVGMRDCLLNWKTTWKDSGGRSEFFETQKFLLLNCFFKRAKLAKFIRYEALWKLLFKIGLFFYHKVHGDGVKWFCFWGHWGTSEMFWIRD